MRLLNCLVYFAVIGMIGFVVGRLIPKRWFVSDWFPYRSFGFEKDGAIYERLKIKSWQNKAPDMSKILPGIMPAKKLDKALDSKHIEQMLRETCVAEFIHAWLCIFGIYTLKLWRGLGGFLMFSVYTLLGNLPYILIQRYNRPKLQRLLIKIKQREERKKKSAARVLILSCNTGEGHNSCAKAIKESFDLHGEYCCMDDALRFISKGLSTVVSKCHVFIYRHLPSLFRFGYRYVEEHAEFYDKHSVAYKILVHGSKNLLDFIREERFDTIICTHPLAIIILNAAIEKGKLTLNTSFVATDYTCSPTAEAGNLDRYFIPDDSLKGEFIAYGIDANKLISSGIPVRQMFFTGTEKSDAKKNFGIDPQHNHLLVMCGSMGCGPMKKLTSILAKGLTKNSEMTVICGTNKRLRRYLERKHGKDKKVHICGYVQDMSGLLDSTDVYLTKPGGISVTEAKTKCLPMVFVNAVAGCEEYNRKFFVERGAAVSEDNTNVLAQKCLSVLEDSDSRTQMCAAMEKIPHTNAAELIYHHIMQTPLCS